MAEQGKSCSKRRKKGNKPTGKKKIRIAIVLGKLRVQNFKRWWLTMSNNLKVTIKKKKTENKAIGDPNSRAPRLRLNNNNNN